MKFNAWTNPRTNETRIYVNSNQFGYGEKVFIKKSENARQDFDLVVTGEGVSRAAREANEDIVINHVAELLEKSENDLMFSDFEGLSA